MAIEQVVHFFPLLMFVGLGDTRKLMSEDMHFEKFASDGSRPIWPLEPTTYNA